MKPVIHEAINAGVSTRLKGTDVTGYNVTVDPKADLWLSGSSGNRVIPFTCTLVRHFQHDISDGQGKPRRESVSWSRDLVCTPKHGTWRVNLGKLGTGVYMFMIGDDAEIDTVILVVKAGVKLAVSTIVANANQISVSGTTLYPNETVHCSLTPVDEFGQPRPNTHTSFKNVVSGQNETWSVSFVPADVGNDASFSGPYAFSAQCYDGTLTETIDV